MEDYIIQAFIQILNTSYQAVIAFIAILLARALMQRMHVPPKYICILWYIPLLRLLPFHLHSIFSLFPGPVDPVPESLPLMEQPQINTNIAMVDRIVNQSLPAPTLGASINPLQILLPLFGSLWLLGMAACLLYGVVSVFRLRYRLRASVCQDGDLYLTDGLPTAFVLGIFRPRIYLPSGIAEKEKGYVACHERQHIRRKDHIFKAAFFLASSICWFHPLLWVAYALAGRDIEAACDEAVAEGLSEEQRKEYAAALLSLAVPGKRPFAAPLGFSEGSLKKRVWQIVHYERPERLAGILGIAVVLCLGVGLLTDPLGMGAGLPEDGIEKGTDMPVSEGGTAAERESMPGS